MYPLSLGQVWCQSTVPVIPIQTIPNDPLWLIMPIFSHFKFPALVPMHPDASNWCILLPNAYPWYRQNFSFVRLNARAQGRINWGCSDNIYIKTGSLGKSTLKFTTRKLTYPHFDIYKTVLDADCQDAFLFFLSCFPEFWREFKNRIFGKFWPVHPGSGDRL
jgi:hypothetical protein